MNRTLLASLLSLSVLAACGEPVAAPPEAAPPPPKPETKTEPLYGQISSDEWALDAPWRIEPELYYAPGTCGSKACPTYRWGSIPLTVSLRDAYQSSLEDWKVGSLVVEEVGTALAPFTIPLASFHEIERTVGTWEKSDSPAYSGPPHTVCRRWRGDNCAGFETLASTSEWDGTAFYTVRQAASAGTRVTLNLRLQLTRTTYVNFTPIVLTRELTNKVVVTLGHPLPRFDDRWVYGDLHYHSQGSDNEGESGYSHRSTLQAMSALGLDFTFATEHASNSRQFDNIADAVDSPGRILRDMSARRWAQLLQGLNGVAGANLEVGSAPRRRSSSVLSAPQLFLGGEVDVIPEIANEDYFREGLLFGNNLNYYWMTACFQIPGSAVLDFVGIDQFGCPEPVEKTMLSRPAYDTQTLAPVAGRWFLKDLQGPALRDYYARQHLLHLPSDPLSETAFVSSSTSVFGGGTRRLATLLDTEYTQGLKGVTFLAHPVDYATSAPSTRLGPDVLPYSLAQLDDAFRNQHMLGLELWNEDTRSSRDLSDPDGLSPVDSSGQWNWPNHQWLFGQLHHGLAAFDRLLLWSVDPARRQGISWLPSGSFRKIFLSGGSDSHGDLNYSRKGYLLGLESINDTAIGKPRNLVMVAQRNGNAVTSGTVTTRAVAQGDVVQALRSGQFIATDGPIVRIAFDTNGNGAIDDTDVPMGGDLSWDWLSPTLRVVVEWKSTPEMGRVTMIDLTVNAFTNSTGNGMSYAPAQHEVRGGTRTTGETGWIERGYTSSNGDTFWELEDNYFLDPTGQLRIVPSYADGYGGRRVIAIDPQRFKTGRIWTTNVPTMSCDNPTTGNVLARMADGGTPEDVGTCDGTRTVSGIEDVRPPDALVIRAMAITDGVGDLDPNTGRIACNVRKLECEPRLALTNPLWAKYRSYGFSLSP